MELRVGQLQPLKVLLIDDKLNTDTAAGHALFNLITELERLDITVIESSSYGDGYTIISTDASLDSILLDWDLGKSEKTKYSIARKLLNAVRFRNEKIPVFLVAEHSELSGVPIDVMQMVDDFIWIEEDTADFIAGRINAAMKKYRQKLLPPFFAALVNFAQSYEYSWHTPGHTGGTAFLKSPVGQAFFNFFGENMLRSDLSISVGELGSLLDHSGPIGKSELYTARIFGAHHSYSVTNGTSTSNRIVFNASLTKDDIALCDRNCHKSIEHSLTLTGAIPTYLIPSRNRYGIIGPIHSDMFKPEAIKKSIRQNPLIPREKRRNKPVHTVITNSTYDGLCYNVRDVIRLLDKSVDRIHFDEAWYGYARFNPIYKERFAMHGNPDIYRGPTLFATQSTHKLLAALSQASFIHVRDGRNPIEFSRFNEAFMMHGSTSPQYAIIASNDIAAGMMDGPGGQALTTDSIREAVAFRKTMARLYKEFQTKDDWFFNVWQPEKVFIGKGKTVSFEDVPDRQLHTDPSCWVLRPGAEWHGFDNLKDNYCMLDPIKVSVITPGVADDGSLENSGIPAMLVTAYLDAQGIVVEKTGDFTMLFLFSMGVTRGKWGTLVTALLDFKQCYDANISLSEVLPSLVKSYPKRYKNMGLRDLSTEMFKQVRKGDNLKLLDNAFSIVPQAIMTPAEAYSLLVKNKVVQLPIDDMANRTVATGVVPYPPGIPLLMPGEDAGKHKDAILAYLRALQAFDRLFPGFEHDIHGVENKDGTYNIYCIKEK